MAVQVRMVQGERNKPSCPAMNTHNRVRVMICPSCSSRDLKYGNQNAWCHSCGFYPIPFGNKHMGGLREFPVVTPQKQLGNAHERDGEHGHKNGKN